MPSATIDWSSIDRHGLELSLEQARKSAAEGGIPIGSVLLIRDEASPSGNKVLGVGHNQRIQKSSATLHGEISALENAGRLKPEVYRKATIVSNELNTLFLQHWHKFQVHYPKVERLLYPPIDVAFKCPTSPCSMCTGAILLYKIGRVVIGENKTFLGGEELLKKEGVEVIVIDSKECENLMTEFINAKPEVKSFFLKMNQFW